MTTALERITQLSGLSGVSAAQHLKQIAGAAGIAGALLVAFSGLPTGTAAEHLLANAVPEQAQSGGAGKGSRGHEVKQRVTTYKLPEAPVTVYNGVNAVAEYVSSPTAAILATVKPDFTVRAPDFAALLETLARPVGVSIEQQSGHAVKAAFIAVQTAGGAVQAGQEIAHKIILSVEAAKIEKAAIAKARQDDDELALMMILAELV